MNCFEESYPSTKRGRWLRWQHASLFTPAVLEGEEPSTWETIGFEGNFSQMGAEGEVRPEKS